jgi:hypothetical protein
MEIQEGRVTDHLAVDELGSKFFTSVHIVGQGFQGLLTDQSSFLKMTTEAERLCSDSQYIGIVITKPPETVAIVIPGRGISKERSVFFFDSHSRPEQNLHGSYLVICNSVESVITRLKRIFPTMAGLDYGNLANSLYNMFEATYFSAN